MATLKVTTSFKWSGADIKAAVMDNGGVKIWHHYEDIDQDRHEIILTDKEWDRLVAWVQWQRRNNEVSEKG
jgi:hypothetical protein